jgi:hypothetical protein
VSICNLLHLCQIICKHYSPCSQEPFTGPYPEPYGYSPYFHNPTPHFFGFDSREGQETLLHKVQTGFGVHPASCSVDTRRFSPGIKWERVKLTTYLHQVPRLWMRGTLSPFQFRTFKVQVPNTPETFWAVSSSGFSRDLGWPFWRYKKNCSNPSHVVHVTFQGVSLEAFSRKLMLWYDCETADWRTQENSRRKVYNAAMHCCDISHHSWLT